VCQQHIERARLTVQRRQHQGRAAAVVARFDESLLVEQSLQFRNVADFGGAAQPGGRVR
jgi:hypothetical protein